MHLVSLPSLSGPQHQGTPAPQQGCLVASSWCCVTGFLSRSWQNRTGLISTLTMVPSLAERRCIVFQLGSIVPMPAGPEPGWRGTEESAGGPLGGHTEGRGRGWEQVAQLKPGQGAQQALPHCLGKAKLQRAGLQGLPTTQSPPRTSAGHCHLLPRPAGDGVQMRRWMRE